MSVSIHGPAGLDPASGFVLGTQVVAGLLMLFVGVDCWPRDILRQVR